MATYTSERTGTEYMTPDKGGYLRYWDGEEYKQVFGARGGAISACEKTLESIVYRHEKRCASIVSMFELGQMIEEGLIDYDCSAKEASKAKLKMMGY